MPIRADEAIVLARHPFRERDLVVTMLAHAGGLVKVLARHVRGARAPKSAALEPLTRARVRYFERPHSELATLDEATVVRSGFALAAAPAGWAAGQVVAELALLFCPPGERVEALFRLVDRCIAALLGGTPPLAVVGYAELWFVKLAGVLPELDRCGACGAQLEPGPRLYDVREGGFVCGDHPAPSTVERVSAEGSAWLRGALKSRVERASEPPADVLSWLAGLIQRFANRELVAWRYLRLVQQHRGP